MWIITKDYIYDRAKETSMVGECSADYEKGAELPYKFRLLDDDDCVYYYGLTDDDSSFDPLDEVGYPVGCVWIEFLNPKTGEWEVL